MKTKQLLLWATGLFLTASLLSSCQKDLEEAAPPSNPPTTTSKPDTSTYNPFKPFPGIKGIVKNGTFRGQPITYKEYNGVAVWQGDILLTKEDLTPIDTSQNNPNARVKGAGKGNKDYRWLGFEIPYQIGPGLNNTAIRQAMDAWEENTPLRFVPRSNQTDYIRFELSTINLSSIGRQKGLQKIQLLNKDNVGVIVHEIGHAIGLYHEHTRSDRNSYVNYYPENVEEGEEYNFITQSDAFNYGKFDFGSIMLYGSTTFGKKNSEGIRQVVLRRKDNNATFEDNIGRGTPSNADNRTVIAMYSNIYVVQHGVLYAVSPEGGQYYARLGGGWAGAAPTIAEDDRYIWLIQGGSLWWADRLNGTYQKVGNGNWNGAVGITGADPQVNKYAQAGDYIWKILRNGHHVRLGGGGWSGTKAMYYLNGWLYVVWKNGYLYKVNTTTGAYQELFGGWGNIKAMAAVRRSAKDLYVMLGSDLWRYNTVSGKSTLVGKGYYNTTAMTGVGGRLYIASDGWLHKVDENGRQIWAKSGYNGVTSMGATHYAGLFD